MLNESDGIRADIQPESTVGVETQTSRVDGDREARDLI